MSVEVVDVTPPEIEVINLAPIQVGGIEVVAGPRGPKGDPGLPGNNASTAWEQMVAVASWSIPHLLGRIPAVALYVAGELVYADVHATPTVVTVVWPSPTTGVAVLT